MLDGDGTHTDSLDLAGLPGYLGYQIRQSQTAVFRDIENRLKVIGVTPGEFGLLTLIGANAGVTPKALSRHYGLDKSTLSYSLNRLARKAWIRRKRDPKDGRSYGLWLTPAGRSKARRAQGIIEAQEALMDTVLKAGERQRLLDMLERLSTVLRGA